MKKYLIMSFILFASSCANSTIQKADSQRFTEKQLKIAQNFIDKNNAPLISSAVDFHNSYYRAVHRDLSSLIGIVSKNQNLKSVRALAIKNLNNDAALMDEVKKYSLSLENLDENESITRLAFNRAPLILRKAAELLADENYFNQIAAGKFPDNFKFSWNTPTFLSGVENIDDKGTIAISALAASLVYLLDENELPKNLYNHSAIIYNESVESVLADNIALLTKLRNNYHLFNRDKNIISKIYEAYEFGGDKDLTPIKNPQFLPFDCATGVAHLLGIDNNPFYTYHLASYYNEYFEKNSSYWSALDWNIRKNISQKLKPAELDDLSKAKPGMVVAWRDLADERSLNYPKGYVGSAGHVGVILGIDGDDLYYISWERDLEAANKSGMGVDALSISKAGESVKDNKLFMFLFEVK